MSVDLEAIEKLCDKQTFTAYGSEVLLGSLADEVPALLAEVRALRAERDKWMADHSRQYSIAAAYAVERDALCARVAELERLGNDISRSWASTHGKSLDEALAAWRKAVLGK